MKYPDVLQMRAKILNKEVNGPRSTVDRASTIHIGSFLLVLFYTWYRVPTPNIIYHILKKLLRHNLKRPQPSLVIVNIGNHHQLIYAVLTGKLVDIPLDRIRTSDKGVGHHLLHGAGFIRSPEVVHTVDRCFKRTFRPRITPKANW